MRDAGDARAPLPGPPSPLRRSPPTARSPVVLLSPRSKAWCAGVALALVVAAVGWLWPREAVTPATMAPGVADAAAADPARRAAAIALARMPDDPWTFAEAVAASSPDGAKAHCGEDERPEFGDPQARDGTYVRALTKPAGPNYVAARRGIETALQSSADPFDRAVADWLNIDDARTPSARLEALVQQATTTTDPRVYALAFGDCTGGRRLPGPCAALNARQWAMLDAGNAMPWLYLFSDAVQAHDVSAQQEAMAHMAAATRFDDGAQAPAGAVAARVPDGDANLSAGYDLVLQASGMSAANTSAVRPLMDACRDKAGGDVNRAQQCEAVADAMFERSDSMVLRLMGAALYYRATGDPSRRDVARGERAVFASHWSPATGFSECQAARDGLRSALRNAAIGEVEAARERSRTFVTP